MKSREWIFEEEPDITTPGWYAVSRCYDPYEGSLASHEYWNGDRWDEQESSADSITGYAGPFESRKEAEQWSYRNHRW